MNKKSASKVSVRRAANTMQLGKSKKSGSMGFEIDKHNSLTGFQKLAYIAGEVGISGDDIARIIEVDPAVINRILTHGLVPNTIPNHQEIFDKLYLMRMLFSSLLRLCQYSNGEVNRLLSDTIEFKQCLEPPPWYPGNLRDYIAQGKTEAVQNALFWLHSY